MNKALYLMIGGFLGAGKTTAILKLAHQLAVRGLRVGLITNDQSVGLVDSVVLGNDRFPVEEITGGCFCCRFNSLVEASERLSRSTRPDVFIAEPVGSCTDLVAAVSFPLRKMYGEEYSVAPLSVLVDPIRAERIFGLEEGKSFSRKVLYVYGKQLEEAEIIVINKCDLLSIERQDRLETALRRDYPQAEVFRVSARQGTGVEPWLDRVTAAGAQTESAPQVDYDTYAEGEALLGWLNASALIRATAAVDGNELLRGIAARTREALRGVEIAHLKMTLVPKEEGGDIGVLNLVRSDGIAELSHSLKEPLSAGELLLNLRAEADPELLRRSVLDAIAACACEVEITNMEHFRPAKPQPTYRMAHI
jgi:Ni2+-binding GTPase involved in maturation of urease and hydrogenase